MKRKTILVTGAGGFIGSHMIAAFHKYKVIACGRSPKSRVDLGHNNTWERLDITNKEDLDNLFKKYRPDVVIHCAGIAHQKMAAMSTTDYFEVNSTATQLLAEHAICANPDVHLIFLSSISVYGEKYGHKPVQETDACRPSSDYADSKLDAENRLVKLCADGKLKKLDVLRLAPVYDRSWSLNIEKRVYAPKKMFFLRFGSGEQRLSMLSRQNLVEFVRFRVITAGTDDFCEWFNVCDARPYTFNEIISVFQKSRHQPSRSCFRVPLSMVKGVAILAENLLTVRSTWLTSSYDKLAGDLVFDNRKMLRTGFVPEYSLASVFGVSGF
ncbi:MAG: NAD-dependent epimerase/dehydratase family protein [Desulfobacterium sp.]|nr:NAD-dependent epimerase/dehydratase family protein [Desulfobacterium sp.]